MQVGAQLPRRDVAASGKQRDSRHPRTQGRNDAHHERHLVAPVCYFDEGEVAVVGLQGHSLRGGGFRAGGSPRPCREFGRGDAKAEVVSFALSEARTEQREHARVSRPGDERRCALHGG